MSGVFRGQAYVFQIWRAVDFGFINVNPPNLKAVNLTPKSSIRVFRERSSIRPDHRKTGTARSSPF